MLDKKGVLVFDPVGLISGDGIPNGRAIFSVLEEDNSLWLCEFDEFTPIGELPAMKLIPEAKYS